MGNDSKQVYETKYYNLDAILSVGYRVNSKNATLFRRWANQVLKEYMLMGYAVNQRKIATDLQIVDSLNEQRQMIENQCAKLDNVDTRLSAVEKHIDFFVKAGQTPTSGILTTGSRFEGFILISDLVRIAKRSLTFIDPYANIDVLKFAAILPLRSIIQRYGKRNDILSCNGTYDTRNRYTFNPGKHEGKIS